MELFNILILDFSRFPSLHPLLIHFPIVFILLAFVVQTVHFFVLQKELSLLTFILITTGFVTAYIAGNFFNPGVIGLSESTKIIFERHRDFAGYTILMAKVSVIAKFFSYFVLKKKKLAEIIVLLLLFGTAILVTYTAHYGAMLVHVEGVGPQGKFLKMN